MEAGGSDVQGYPQLHVKFQANLSHMRPCVKKNEKKSNT